MADTDYRIVKIKKQTPLIENHGNIAFGKDIIQGLSFGDFSPIINNPQIKESNKAKNQSLLMGFWEYISNNKLLSFLIGTLIIFAITWLVNNC